MLVQDAAKQREAIKFCINTEEPPLGEEHLSEDTESDLDDDEEVEEEGVSVAEDEAEEKYCRFPIYRAANLILLHQQRASSE